MKVASIAAAVAFGFVSSASAAPVTLNGITFAEQTGAFEITSGSGTGTGADPFVINETVTGLDVTMSISGLTSSLSEVGSFTSGFFITKVVTNNTTADWSFYDNELQETLGTPSADGDGLSFAQGFAAVRPFTSDVFTSVFEESTIRDQVTFLNGLVKIGETVSMSFAITDNTPIDEFFLRQRPNFVDPGVVPVPAALPLLVTAIGAMGFAARRRKAA